MRALSSFQRIVSALGAAPSETFAASLIGAGGCRLRGLNTTRAAAQGKVEPIPDALDQEFDRGEDEAMARVHEREMAEREAALKEVQLKCPVDLETEFDRDDPDAVNPEELYKEPVVEPLSEVDLDTEFDRDDPMMADKSHLWDVPEPPQPANIDGELDLMADRLEEGEVPAGGPSAAPWEGPGGPMGGNAPFGQGGRRAPEEPDPRIGQYREKKAA